MRKIPIFIFIIWLFSVSAFAQEAKLIDEFEIIPCGDFLARMDSIAITFEKRPNSKIYVVYYGGRYRRDKIWNSEMKKQIVTGIKFAHRDDGLNWAKSIPLYFGDELGRYGEKGKKILENIVLLNGGYLEDTTVDIWIVPNGSQPPTPRPKIAEKDIEFKAAEPIPIRRQSLCYSGY